MTPTAAANAYASMAQQLGNATQSAGNVQPLAGSGATPDGFAGLVREAIEATAQQAQQAVTVDGPILQTVAGQR